MALTLYHGAPNGPSLAVLAALFETGVEAELKPIDLTRGERHAASTPRNMEVEMSVEGEGPVLVADGEAMADSVFLACYLDEVGNGSIRPADPYKRWEMMAWCRYAIERVAPAAALLGTREHLTEALGTLDNSDFDAITAPIANLDLKERWIAVRGGDFSDAQLADSQAKIGQAVKKVEGQLDGRDWLMGDFSIADLETYGWLAGLVEILPDAFAEAPRTAAWLARVKARPSVQKALATAGEGDPLHAWAPGPEINRWG